MREGRFIADAGDAAMAVAGPSHSRRCVSCAVEVEGEQQCCAVMHPSTESRPAPPLARTAISASSARGTQQQQQRQARRMLRRACDTPGTGRRL